MEESIRERLDQFISKKGLRQTSQRDEIVDVIFASDEHFTPEQLFDRLRLAGSAASRATVYHTLALLDEAGLIHEIELGNPHHPVMVLGRGRVTLCIGHCRSQDGAGHTTDHWTLTQSWLPV